MGQMGFFDLSDGYASLEAQTDPLVEFDAVVPWEGVRPALERVWRRPVAARRPRAGPGSGPGRWMLSFGPVALGASLFKALALSPLDTLSDDQMKYQGCNRLSFMRFLVFGLDDRVPDARTGRLYREGPA